MSFNPYQWYKVISDLIHSSDPDIDTSIGTLIGDTTVLPMSVLYEKIRILKNFILKIISLTGLASALKDNNLLSEVARALDTTEEQVILLLKTILKNIAADYGITRYPAKPASGIVYFALSPKSNYNGIYQITQADRVQSIFGLAYMPDQNYIFVIDGLTQNTSIETYYVPELGVYAFPVRVRHDGVGSIGNIDRGQIYSTLFVSPSPFQFVTNLTPIDGGRDEETDEQLIERIKLKWQGSNLGTRGGYLSILNEYGITDAYIAGPGDQYMYRTTNNGNVDIYIRAFQTISRTVPGLLLKGKKIPNVELYTIKNFIDNNVIPGMPPIKTVTGIVTAGETPPNDFRYYLTILPDKNITYRNSPLAGDKLVVSMYDSSNIYQYKFDVILSYNYYIEFFNELLNSDKYHILGHNILVREALPVNIKSKIKIRVLPGYSPEFVKSQVYNTVLSYVNNLKMGSKLSQSDLVSVIENVPGVDLVIVPFDQFNIVQKTDIATDIQASPISFLQFGSFNFPRMPIALLETGGNLSAETAYFYRIIAKDIDGNITSSKEIMITTTTTHRSIQLTWMAVDNAVTYHVYRGTASNTYTGYFIIDPTDFPSFLDSGSIAPLTPIILTELEAPSETIIPLLQINLI